VADVLAPHLVADCRVIIGVTVYNRRDAVAPPTNHLLFPAVCANVDQISSFITVPASAVISPVHRPLAGWRSYITVCRPAWLLQLASYCRRVMRTVDVTSASLSSTRPKS